MRLTEKEKLLNKINTLSKKIAKCMVEGRQIDVLFLKEKLDSYYRKLKTLK